MIYSEREGSNNTVVQFQLEMDNLACSVQDNNVNYEATTNKTA